jgi:tetratricopeptide (TPR) repeat protein
MLYLTIFFLIFISWPFLRLAARAVQNLAVIVGAPTRRAMDASHLDKPLPQKLQTHMEFFSSQGFVRLGEAQITMPFRPGPDYEWKFISTDRTITLDLVEIAPNMILLSTHYPDGAFLETQFPFGEKIDTRDFRSHTITTDLDTTYQYHLQQMKTFGALHGEPVKTENMKDALLADEIYRQKHVLLKFRRNLWVSLLMMIFPVYVLGIILANLINFRWEHITNYESNRALLLTIRGIFPALLILVVFNFFIGWSHRREAMPSANSRTHRRQGFQILFLFLLVVAGIAYFLKPNSVPQNYRQAVRALDAEEYQYAINYSDEVIRADPENGAAYQVRGTAHLQLLEIEPAIKDLTRAIELGNTDPSVYIFRGLAYESQLRYEAAIADYGEYTQLEPDSSLGFFARGAAYYEIDEYNKSILDFDRTIQMGTLVGGENLGGAYYRRGLAYLALKNTRQALSDFSESILLEPENSRAYYGRALVYYDQKNYFKVLTDLDHAISIDPTYANAFYLRGLTHAASADYAQAITDYSQALVLNPSHENSYFARAIAYQQSGYIDQAILDYRVVFRMTSDLERQKEIEEILQKLEH